MPRELQRIDPPPRYPNDKCRYRKACPNKATHYYTVPSKTRWGNLSVRLKYVCDECAEIIRRAYPGTVSK